MKEAWQMESTETFIKRFPEVFGDINWCYATKKEKPYLKLGDGEGYAKLPTGEQLRFMYRFENGTKLIIDGWTTLEDKQSQTPTYYGTGTTDPISYMKQHYTHEQLEGFLLGNIIKYATRANKKNGVEDYKKLAHYAQMLLEHAEGEAKR